MTQAWLEKIWRSTERQLTLPAAASVTVVVVGDKAMKTMNTRYRGVASVTDVLSFSYDPTAGDIMVCYPQAKRQAAAKQQALKRECAWLVVHGILHWRGYDHETAADARIMRPLEQRILRYV